MGRGRIPPCDAITATEFHRFLDAKVDGVHATTTNAPPPSFSTVPPGCSLHAFQSLVVEDVVTAVRALPTRLLKENVDVLAPFLVELHNRSLQTGSVPTSFKSAYITPLLKKAKLNPANPKSNRPIANLSKLLERLMARQLVSYMNVARLLPDLQSAYRAHHSTETAVAKVLSDILTVLDTDDIGMLTLLDLSATFDTVNHDILLRCLAVFYCLGGTVLSWFQSYLDGRIQFVRRSRSASAPALVKFGVPQGSVLGLILFQLYTADLLKLIEKHNLHAHAHADDTQIYGFCLPSDATKLQMQVPACIDEVALWMQSNRLHLNTAKTEILWCATNQRQHLIPQTPTRIGDDYITPAASIRTIWGSTLTLTSP